MAPSISSEGFDYDQLFKGTTAPRGSDLMLLSVPTDYDRMVELTNAAQRGHCPKRILLLSDTPVLPYPLADLPLTRSEEHTYELQSLMRIPSAVICLTTKTNKTITY